MIPPRPPASPQPFRADRTGEDDHEGGATPPERVAGPAARPPDGEADGHPLEPAFGVALPAAARRPGLTLVLGGGGFKGLAHVGVLMVLEEEGLPVERIVGTSAGALIGASYAYCGSAERVREVVLGFVGSDAFQRRGFVGFKSRARGPGLASLLTRLLSGIKRQVALERMFRRNSAFGGAPLRFVVRHLVPRGSIEKLPLPVAIAVLDLQSGEEVLLTEGDLRSAVCASSSVPGFFPPVEREGRVLVDAGVVDNLPTRAARALGATRIVAVDLASGLGPVLPGEVGIDVLLRTQDIATRANNRRSADDADVLIRPALAGRSWLDASDPPAVLEAGRQAAHAALPELRELLATVGPRAFRASANGR